MVTAAAMSRDNRLSVRREKLTDHEVSERTTRNRYLSLSRARECLDGTLSDLQSESFARFLLSVRHTIRNLQNGDITPFFFEDSVRRSFPSLKDVEDCVICLEVVLPFEACTYLPATFSSAPNLVAHD